MLDKIRAFIIENYLFGEDGKLNNSDSFMESGIIDSTGILELVRFLEATFDVKVADEDLIPDNLDSIEKIMAFVQAKQASAAAARPSSLQSAAR
jgi:acyl carrier protein